MTGIQRNKDDFLYKKSSIPSTKVTLKPKHISVDSQYGSLINDFVFESIGNLTENLLKLRYCNYYSINFYSK